MNLGQCIKLLIFLLILILAGCTYKGPTYGLNPEYPENRYRQFCAPYSCTIPEIVFTEVDSLQPTFKWESFPRLRSIEKDEQGFLSKIKDVTYDLKIWKAENEFPSFLIYSRQALPEPSHRIEQPLEPCAKYFWSVRARFKIDGETRVTEWGISQIPEPLTIRRSPIIPNPNLYRFKTPCIKTSTDENK